MTARLKALLVVADKVFVAGLTGPGDAKTGAVWIYGSASGRSLGQVALGAAPLFNGMAAVEGRMLVCTEGGRVICLGR